ncbi:MAG: TIGR04283 family arsenosugar biosynthesis glycosyltransferase [Kiloniellales bacterium]
MRLSIIIATLNEAPRIATTLAAVRMTDPEAEVIVVDGGSRDGTARVARQAGARVLTASRGRGAQLAAGAKAASGDVLVFLHADTSFPLGAPLALRRALRDPRVIGGNFRVVFEDGGGADDFARWLTGFYAWFRHKGLYYGDSVMFLRRAVYQELGGFRPIALMEDYDLNRRMERRGGTVCIEEPPVVTSARRFAGRRPAAIFCQWLLLHALYYLHLPPPLLAWLYDSERHRTAS